MATKTWQSMKKYYCPRVQQEITLETLVVYPAEHLPDQPPRVLGHRCSAGLKCNLMDKPGCVWSGTNPGYNPLADGGTLSKFAA